jgi:hypothetical protein
MADAPAYCIVDVPNSLVLPADVAMKLFPLLCQGEPVQYDWSDKVHKRVKPDRDGCTIKQFTIAQYAQLALNDDVG